jgi:hypothetical protein
MSRAKATDVSSPISLFPFIGVLLCTMGSLLVVLIAVSPSARDVALRQAATRRPASATEIDPNTRKKLQELNQYLARLNAVRADAERKLREDHRRLEHLESHMRRLQDQLHSLQAAAVELLALEDEHYDDREQAEREIDRLQQLISQTREAIDSIKADQQSNKRSYALVPYEGPNGTFRRPIYVECRDGEVILQPEGVVMTRDDLRPPLGPGNALAAALRAARDHLLRLYPAEGQSRDTEPYPLIVVRPSGAMIFSHVQKAIRSGDFDFGYELVEEDWDLKFAAPDPQLAMAAQQAIDLARVRQEALAAAAPRAYRHPALASAGQFDFDGTFNGPVAIANNSDVAAESDGDPAIAMGGDGPGQHSGGRRGSGHAIGRGGAGGNGANAAGPGGGVTAEVMTQNSTPGDVDAARNHGEAARGNRSSTGVATQDATAANADGAAAGDNKHGYPGGPLPAGVGPEAASGNAAPRNAANAAASRQATANGGANISYGTDADSHTGGAAEMGVDYSQMQTDLASTRGADWALKQKRARSVPIRRPIQVVVRSDRISILSDDRNARPRAAAAQTILLKRDTVQSIDEFVDAVDDQIESWGVAGDGMYWRPVLRLHIAPEGRRRAQDLTRLLRNSGLEIQAATTANLNQRGNSRATTR